MKIFIGCLIFCILFCVSATVQADRPQVKPNSTVEKSSDEKFAPVYVIDGDSFITEEQVNKNIAEFTAKKAAVNTQFDSEISKWQRIKGLITSLK